MTARVRLLALVAVAVASVGLLAAGGHELGPGAVTDLRAARERWLAAEDPVTVTIAVLRLTAMAAAAWIALTAIAHLTLRSGRRRWLDRLTPGLVRAAAGASLSLAVLGGPAVVGAAGAGDPHHQATMRPVAADEPASTTSPPTSTTSPPTSTTSTPPAPPTAFPSTTTVPPAPAPAPAARPAPAGPAPYVVERSDSLWSIAADTVAARLGRSATDREVNPYWQELIAANAGRLVVPGNADLIYAGQELVLPT